MHLYAHYQHSSSRIVSYTCNRLNHHASCHTVPQNPCKCRHCCRLREWFTCHQLHLNIRYASTQLYTTPTPFQPPSSSLFISLADRSLLITTPLFYLPIVLFCIILTHQELSVSTSPSHFVVCIVSKHQEDSLQIYPQQFKHLVLATRTKAP